MSPRRGVGWLAVDRRADHIADAIRSVVRGLEDEVDQFEVIRRLVAP